MTAPLTWTPDTIRRAWDARADRYLELFRNELVHKAFDQAVLKSFATRVGASGRVADVGCGPCGHVAELLTELGLGTLSIDVSPRCIELARREQRRLRFEVMDLAALALPGDHLDGLVAYFALHDQPTSRLQRTFREFARVSRSGAQLLVAAMEGDGEGLVPDPFGTDLTVYWASLSCITLQAHATFAGFRVTACTIRDPLPREPPSRRIYLTAVKDG